MDEQRRAEVLWAHSITHERILERLVKKEHISQERADAIFGIHETPKILSENCDQALSRLCKEIKRRLSKLRERDITKNIFQSTLR